MAFDLVRLDGEFVMDRPYRERREMLETLQLQGSHSCTPQSHLGTGRALFDATKEMGLGSVVAKGRSRATGRAFVRALGSIKTPQAHSRLTDGCVQHSFAPGTDSPHSRQRAV
jgi:alpha-D-ribose 1-methylphosphonate 5-triphosphate synthase subunit PhnG